MKKILSIGLVFCLIFSLLISLPVKAQASNDLEFSTGGTASKVTYSQVSNAEEIRIFASSTQIVRQFVIPPDSSCVNYRLGFEIAGVSVPRTIRQDINKGTVVQVRLANLSDPVRTSVVVETTKQPDYTLAPASDGKSVVVKLKGFTTPSATPAPSTTPEPSTTPKPTPTPTPSSTPTPSTTPVPVTSTPASNNGNTGPITKNGPLSWTISGDTCTIKLDGISLTQSTIGNTPRFEVREKEKIIQITIPGKNTSFKDGYLSGNSVIYGILVNYSTRQNSTVIRISYPNTITYSHAISSGSSVLKIKSGSTSAPVTSTPNPLPSSTPAPSKTPVASTTPTPSGTTPGSGSLTFSPGSAMANVSSGSGDVALRLVNKGIASRYQKYEGEIIYDDSVSNSTFAFVIPRAVIDVGNGTALTNDSLTKSIVSVTTQENSFLLLNKVDPNKKFKIVEQGPDELRIVVDKGTSTTTPSTSKLVVLDPGHGGSDPGAVVGSYYEKNYNLDIALRCQSILKSKGINVAMTRTTDVFVGLDERAQFANDRNAALFVSIHNNIMPAGMKGSMTMYYHTSYSGKAYAQIVQNNMIKDLGTSNIGLKAVQDIVVIKKTKMPAVLAEVACMSDAGDLAKLNTEAFIQKAAESLAKSIIQIMSTM